MRGHQRNRSNVLKCAEDLVSVIIETILTGIDLRVKNFTRATDKVRLGGEKFASRKELVYEAQAGW